MNNIEKQRKLKASEQSPQVWEERLFIKLFKRLFIESTPATVYAAMNHDAKDGSMPPEYKDRPLHQGIQRRFRRRYKNGRVIEVLTSFSKLKNRKKEAYFGWVILSGKGIKTKRKKFFSSPVYDYDSFFETMLKWVDAFIDIAEHWPVGKDGVEYDMEHIPGVLNMTQFIHVYRNGSTTKRTSFLLINCATFSKKTISFLKRKMWKNYQNQVSMKESGEKPKRTPRRVKSSQRRDEAIAKQK